MTAAQAPVALRAEQLCVRFGGVVAVDDVSFEARGGAITGLIGPNGAGKTTTLNALTGSVPATGEVWLGARPLHGHETAARARAGLGRTFQRMKLVDSMTVQENVEAGPELLLAGRRAWRYAVATPSERRRCRDRGSEALQRCGIAALHSTRAGDLSTGQRRLVELARATACGFPFLLLDEPSSGLNAEETHCFGDVLCDLARRGTGIVVVEHDMALVRAVCTELLVLEFGRLIARGLTDTVLASAIVRAAYLGSVGSEPDAPERARRGRRARRRPLVATPRPSNEGGVK